MERVRARVSDNVLHPADSEAEAVFGKLKDGEIVGVEVYRERNVGFNAKVNHIFLRLAEAKGVRVRNIRGWIAAMTGRADIVHIDGRKIAVAWATSPRDMSAEEFQAFYEDARTVIRELILPKLAEADAKEIEELMRD
jgi:hypothetical protein